MVFIANQQATSADRTLRGHQEAIRSHEEGAQAREECGALQSRRSCSEQQVDGPRPKILRNRATTRLCDVPELRCGHICRIVLQFRKAVMTDARLVGYSRNPATCQRKEVAEGSLQSLVLWPGF